MKAQMKSGRLAGLFQFALLASLALGMSACTKTKETKSMVSPDAYMAKSDLEGKTFSLVRGIEEADSNNGVWAIPGFSEDFGFVKVRITETEVQFIEVFNPQNKEATATILAAYPIKDHFDIQREENDFKESTHRIVENREKVWNARKFMRVDWSRPTNPAGGLNSFMGGSVPYSNVVQLTDPKIESDGHISWLNEFSMNEGSLFGWDSAPGSRVTARTHLMPLKASDYEPVNYREKDFKRFGYFYTQQRIEDPERGFRDSQLENHMFANLHNVCEPGRTDKNGKALSCSTNKIVWHLNKGYPEKFIETTRKAVKEWNDVFKAALGRQDDVIVLNEADRVDFVDPRVNTLAVYSPKSPGGLLGVAQSVYNPITGQTIASRATVYEDGIRSVMGSIDDVITMILADEEVRHMFLATDAEAEERLSKLFSRTGGFRVQEDVQKASGGVARIAPRANSASRSPVAGGSATRPVSAELATKAGRRAFAAKFNEPVERSVARKESIMKKAPELFAVTELSKFGGALNSFKEVFGMFGAKSATKSRLPSIGGLEHIHDIGNELREERVRMMNQAYTGVHGSELVDEAAIRYIRKALAKYPNLSDFKSQISVIKAEVEQLTFYTTLLHEMGHTLGLRHNFHGSSDSKHYHPEFHRLSKQMEQEAALPPAQRTVSPYDLHSYMTASIMDYAADFYEGAGGLSQYDSAAIKYGYNRSIDKENDAIVKADFKFCTDHQVNDTILCRRFDKGRNASEITFNLVETYHQNWVLSHFRNDRANFERAARNYPMFSLGRYFVPIRQVMDEFLYSIIDAKDVAAGENECGMAHWKASVDAGEIVNVCNPFVAEQAGVDPTDIGSFEAGLFGEQGLMKTPTEYQAYGLADLTFANMIAKEFFNEVLGSTVPGLYIAEPVGPGQFALQALPEGGAIEETLAEFASSRGFPTTPEFVDQLKQFVGKIPVGRYGKPFVSEADEDGPFVRQKNIGSFWDKYVAMVALGLKDIGVEKYYRRSMTGNAYAYPHTTKFARQTIKAMITQKDRLLTVPFKAAGGVVSATVEPALNLDVKAIGTITALVDFVSDSDESIADALRVCSVNEEGCRSSFGAKQVEFTTASGQDVFRSVQTLNNDSIAFDLLTEAAEIDKNRKEWVEKQQKATDTIAKSIKALTEMAAQREKLQASLESLKIEELKPIIPVLFSNDPKTPSMWNIVNLVATQGEKIPLFATLNLVRQAGSVFGATAQVLGGTLQALDPKNECPMPAEEAPAQPGVMAAAPAAGGTGLPSVMSLEDPAAEPQAPATAAPNNNGARRFAFRLSRGARLRAGSPLLAANNNTPVPNGPRPAVVNDAGDGDPGIPDEVKCKAVNDRRNEILAVGAEFEKFATSISEIMNGSVEIKAAPLNVKRATDELARAEANIRLIRRVSKATGVE